MSKGSTNKGLSLVIITVVLGISLSINAILLHLFDYSAQGLLIAASFAFLIGVLLYFFLSAALFAPFYDSKNRIETIITNSLHELNTPIATIELNIKMLKKKLTEEKERKYLERIESSSKTLLKLYEKMEYRLKKEVADVEKEEFFLKTSIMESLERFKELSSGLRLSVDVDEHLKLFCNKNGFEEVLDNLISNAIKYNKINGSIAITYKDGALYIKDSGVGIDTKNLFDVFDRYFQEDSSQKGAGLGLNIVKDFCDKNGVKIHIDSEQNIGSTFTLHIGHLTTTLRPKVTHGSY